MAKKYNCTKNGIQYFRKTKTIGHKLDGTPIKKEFYGDGEKDCDKQIEEYMNKIKDGLKIDKDYITLEQLMREWLFDVMLPSKNVKSASFEKHECNYRHYIKDSEIGYLRISTITTKPIQLYYNKLYKNREDKKISSEKIFDINKTLRLFFNYCVLEHYIKENPCSLTKIQIPGDADLAEDNEDSEEEEITPFCEEEVNKIIKNIKYQDNLENTFKVAVQLDLVTGLRKGELLALTKKDVNLDKCTLRIRKTLSLVKVFLDENNYYRELRLITPKTKTSIRTVHFPVNMKPILEKYFKEQELKHSKAGLEFNSDSLIFSTNTCKPIDPTNFSKAWQRFLKRIQLTHKKFHALRDTYAVSLVRRGAKILDVKELLGHSTIKTTEKYYLCAFPEDKTDAANLINDFIL